MAERVSRAEQQAQTRRRLLDEGRRVFAERGFNAATVEEITEAAGITRGALYKHFDGKEGLFLALAAEIGERQLASWAEDEQVAVTDEQHLAALAAPVESADVALGLAGVEFLAHIRSRPQFHAEAAALQAQIDVRATELLRHTYRSLGLEPAIPAEDLVPLVTGLANGLALRTTLDPGLDLNRLFRAGLVALLTGAAQALPTTSEELADDRH
jgi:AcrR family transcriptional regulator